MTDPLIGKQLANFRIERLLGQGGMATVYFGQDIKLHRLVAIKVLDKRYRKHPAYASRFVAEARMMAKWRHENIIQIYYADDAEDVSYYAMDYVDGEDLSAILDSYHYQSKLMPIADVIRIAKAVANALDYAHRQGVIHRDVKPSNILLSKDGRVLLGDFGMALEVQDGSQGNAFGTPHYISPEQARRSSDAVPQSDIYSFGVILYEMLTGMVPFDDSSSEEIALKHIAQTPIAPRSINPQLSKEVEAFLLKTLDKSPKNRYQSGAELIIALEEALQIKASAKKLSLPPLPAGVPTIRRDDYETGQILKRKTPAHESPQPPTVIAGNPSRKKNIWIFGILFLILLTIAGFYFNNNRLTPPNLFPTSTVGSAPLLLTSTPVSVTETLSPLQPSPTFTVVPPTATVTPTPTLAVPTVLYPDGNLFTLYYNETSFFMVNRSFAKRTISGFSFERLDESGKPYKDKFEGYRWENNRSEHLPRNYCVNITVYGDQDPAYLNPPECLYGIINTVQPRFDRPEDLLFWTPKASSMQFRVLWLKEEVARCDIAAGVCDFYIP
jgi:serine/threonine protein kinase